MMMTQMMMTGREKCAELMTESEADVNKQDVWGYTAVMWDHNR